MAQDWQVESATGRCTTSGRQLEEGEAFYTVLFEDGEAFRRVDYSVSAWEGPPEGAYCHFKSRVPVRQKRKRLLVDNEMLVSFFVRLADEEQDARIQFRFVIALILMRKRLLRYDGCGVREGVEVWDMTLLHDQTSHQVVNPRLTDAQIEGVSQQLSSILHADMGEFAVGNTGDTPPDTAGRQADHEDS